jgi:hypothetical protein
MIAKVLIRIQGFVPDGVCGGSIDVDFPAMGMRQEFHFISTVSTDGSVCHSIYKNGETKELFLKISRESAFAFSEDYGTIRNPSAKLIAAQIRRILSFSVSDLTEKTSKELIEEGSCVETHHVLLLENDIQCEVLFLMCSIRTKEKVHK